jgi:hypothetical protein
MTYFDFADWRREIEQAITRGETVPIRVLLDQAERAFERIEAEAAAWDYAESADAPASEGEMT